MARPSSAGRSVVDATRNLIDAAEALTEQRRHADQTAAALEERWAGNRLRLAARASQFTADEASS